METSMKYCVTATFHFNGKEWEHSYYVFAESEQNAIKKAIKQITDEGMYQPLKDISSVKLN